MKNPLISIIIACYNDEEYIKKCLETLVHQTLNDFEIIIVDDGSTDNSWKLLSELSNKQINKLQIFRVKHQGPAKARNLGVRYARGKILVFIDSDMFFEKDFLSNLIKPILLSESRGTFSESELVANWHNVWARCWNYNWDLPDKKRINPLRSDQIKDFRAILKSEFIKVRGFEDIGYTDTWTLSEKLGYLPLATKALYYHYNPSSLKKVFTQAKWVAKRPYKLKQLGKVLALLRANFIFSIFNGLRKAIIKNEPGFIIFKIVYDLGYSLSILESVCFSVPGSSRSLPIPERKCYR